VADLDAERQFDRQWPELSFRCGALPFRSDDIGDMQFLLIRRRGDEGWSVPKGNLIPGSTMAGTAVTEAFEEAGVCGTVAPRPLGSYRHLKCGRGILTLPRFVEVVLFPLEVETQVDHWPERGLRERRWFNRNEVRYVIEPRPLWNLISLFDTGLPALAMNA